MRSLRIPLETRPANPLILSHRIAGDAFLKKEQRW